MGNKINILFFFLFGIFAFNINCYAQKDYSDIEYLKKSLVHSDFYEFIKYDKNMLEWHDVNAISPFFEKLKNVDKDKIVILHIGDSHIQSDIGAGTTRALLQKIFGVGGRGMVFPYQIAKTHSAFDYYAKYSGTWIASKNVELKPKLNIGISGITCFTNDSSANFQLIFKNRYYPIHSSFTKLRMYCHKGKESFDIKIRPDKTDDWIDVNCNSRDSLPYVEILLPKSFDTLYVNVNKTSEAQKYFELYGIEIQGIKNSGIQYMSVGINGAGYHSFFNQNLMKNQLKFINPDMIIFDLGINDFYRGAFNYQYVMSSINKAIAFFKETCPNSVFVLPNAQDIYYRGRNITNCKNYSTLTRLIAKEQNIVLYDYFNISGGPQSMLLWAKNDLAQRDKVHLSYKGYKTKGELFCNAILNSYITYLSKKPDSLLVLNDCIDTTNFQNWIINKSTYYNRKQIETSDKINSYKDKPIVADKPTLSGDGKYYIVRSGDNLGSIANKFGVTVSKLQSWNNLKSTTIYAGQKLLVGGSSGGGSVSVKEKTEVKTTTQQGAKKIVYTIKKGDNLFAIAKTFNVSVDDIKQWNGLSSNNITAGKSLVIYSSVSAPKTTAPAQTSSSSKPRNISYVVKSGDSLWSIANKYGTTVERIKKDNKLNSDKLILGQKLIIN